jgi:hypothetical protein
VKDFGAALYRSGFVPKAAVALVGLGAVGYAAGFLLSIYLAVGGIITRHRLYADRPYSMGHNCLTRRAADGVACDDERRRG